MLAQRLDGASSNQVDGWISIAADGSVTAIANDCGPVSNPDGLKNQLEGGALHGVSRSLSAAPTSFPCFDAIIESHEVAQR